ncbi:hypothetical protein PFISCL1PPCAC_20084, partial [Pristionchus fissidentatus]
KWREDAENRVFSMMREAKSIYNEIITNSHCTRNISLCQDQFDELPEDIHEVFSYLTTGGLQFSRSNSSLLPFPSFPSSNNSIPFPHSNYSLIDSIFNSTLNSSKVPSRDESLIDYLTNEEEEEERFSFGNIRAYENWCNYWMDGLMNRFNWNRMKDSILAWKDGNASILPQYPSSPTASIVLISESNWTLSVLNTLTEGIDAASRIGLDINATQQVSTALSTLTNLISSVTQKFDGNMVERTPPSSPQLQSSAMEESKKAINPSAISPIEWTTSVKNRFMDSNTSSEIISSSSINSKDAINPWMKEAQLMHQTMNNMGATEEIMGFLDSLYTTAKSAFSSSRSRRWSGSRIDLIYSQNSVPSVESTTPPSPPSPPSFSSILSNAGSLIGGNMIELEQLGSGIFSHVVNSLNGMANNTSLTKLPPSLSSLTSNLTAMEELAGSVSNLTSLVNNSTTIT